jgi:hypothetical protein
MQYFRLLSVILVASLFNHSVLADDKKEMIVEAGQSARQVNNHPWSYTSPGSANTNCTTTGTVNATATNYGSGTTNVNGTVDSNTGCNTTYHPPTTYNGNRVTVDNSSWVTDVQTGEQYLIECTAGWAGSKCSYLTGGRYKAELKGNNMWITGQRGMKTATAKYRVLQYVAAPPRSMPRMANTSNVVASSSSAFTSQEIYSWQLYQASSPENKDYITVYCAANATGTAAIPRSKITAGLGAEHAVDCASWISAHAKVK